MSAIAAAEREPVPGTPGVAHAQPSPRMAPWIAPSIPPPASEVGTSVAGTSWPFIPMSVPASVLASVSGPASTTPASGVGITHEPALHTNPFAQSVSPVHVVKHTVPLHPKFTHGVAVPVPQAPMPSHVAAVVATPPVHAAGEHSVVVFGKVHAVVFIPSQVPAQVPVPAHAVRIP